MMNTSALTTTSARVTTGTDSDGTESLIGNIRPPTIVLRKRASSHGRRPAVAQPPDTSAGRPDPQTVRMKQSPAELFGWAGCNRGCCGPGRPPLRVLDQYSVPVVVSRCIRASTAHLFSVFKLHRERSTVS